MSMREPPEYESPTQWVRDRRSEIGLAAGALVMLVLGISGLIVASGGDGDAMILVFRMNTIHSVLLIVAGVLGLLASLDPHWALLYVLFQALGFVFLFIYSASHNVGGGVPTVFGLNVADSVLHLVIIAWSLLMAGFLGARVIEGPWPRHAPRPSSRLHLRGLHFRH